MLTVSCLAPMVLLAGYCEVSIKYALRAGSLLFKKNNRAVNLPAAAITLFIVVSLGIQLKHRDGMIRATVDGRALRDKEGESTATPSVPLGTLVSSKLQGAFCKGHGASNSTGVEEPAEHSPASRVACAVPPSLLYCNCNEQFIF